MKVVCVITEIDLENEDGYPVAGVVATCSRCDHETESFGTHEASRMRCLVLMREECPLGESNFYTEE